MICFVIRTFLISNNTVDKTGDNFFGLAQFTPPLFILAADRFGPRNAIESSGPFADCRTIIVKNIFFRLLLLLFLLVLRLFSIFEANVDKSTINRFVLCLVMTICRSILVNLAKHDIFSHLPSRRTGYVRLIKDSSNYDGVLKKRYQVLLDDVVRVLYLFLVPVPGTASMYAKLLLQFCFYVPMYIYM